jgi:iron complex outermembrane receptor protein
MQGWGRLCALFCLCVGLVTHAQAEEVLVRFDIPAAEARTGLTLFARQSGTPVLFMNEVLGSRRTNAVNGKLTIRQALEILLRHTAINGVINEAGVLTISVGTSENNAAGGETTMHENENHTKRGAAFLAAMGAFFAGGFAAHADENSVTPQAATGGLEEIIVTARRREENLQTVPIAITALSQATLQQNNIVTVGDLEHLVPSLSTSAGFTRDSLNITIRGQGLSGLAGLPAVVAYLNEVPLPTDQFGNYNGGPGTLFDLENVQVLKGPQGTLFGRNTTGGAVLLTTARPTEDFGGAIQVGAGNYNDREYDGHVNIPIVPDKLLTRIAINGQVRDGFTNVLGTPSHPNGVDADNRDFYSVRGTVQFRPTDWFENTTIATYQNYDSNGSPSFLWAVDPTNPLITGLVPTLPALLAQQQALGTRTHLAQSSDMAASGNTFVLNNLTSVKLGDDVTFRNIFGYVRASSTEGFEWDGTNLAILDILRPPFNETHTQYTEEAQLQGKVLRGDWTLGAFYLDDTPAGFSVQHYVAFLTAEGLNLSKRGSESTGVYLHTIYDLSALLNGLQISGGARYTWDKRSYEYFGCPGTVVCSAPITSLPSRSDALTWDVALDYQATSGTMLYATARRGYRAGGANQPVVTQSGPYQPPPFQPEFVTDVELGVKSDWNLGAIPIRTDVDIYRQNYTSIQATENTLAPGNNLIITTGNGAEARIWGAEAEGHAQLTKDLQIGGHFDWIDVEYTKFDPGVAPVTTASLLANRTLLRPRFKYGVDAIYHLPLSEKIGDISAGVNWNWQASNGDQVTPYSLLPAYGLLNFSANWERIYGSHLDTSFFMSNALDKDYIISNLFGYSSFGFTDVRYGEPRMYGFRVRYKFGAEK